MDRAQKLARLRALRPDLAATLGADAEMSAIDEALAQAEPAAGSLQRIDESVVKESDAAMSLEDRMSAVHRAVDATYSEERATGRLYAWAHLTYEDSVVFRKGGNLYQVGYSIDASGTVVFDAEPKLVRLTPTRVETGAKESVDSHLCESLRTFPGAIFGPIAESDGEVSGRRWDIIIIKAGESLNRRLYDQPVLEAAAPLYEGVKIYRDHEESHRRHGRSVDDVIGFIDQVRPAMLTLEAKGKAEFVLMGRSNITDETIRGRMLEAWKLGKPDLYGYSHSIGGKLGSVEVGGRKIERVESIGIVHSVDLVTSPAAGGRTLAVTEGVVVAPKVYTFRESEGDTAMKKKLLERLKLLNPAAAEALGADPTEEALMEALDAALAAATAKSDLTPPAKATEAVDASAELLKKMQESLDATNRRLAMADVDAVLAESTLPKPLKERLRKQFEASAERGEMPTRVKVAEAVEAEKAVYGQIMEGHVRLPGAGGANIPDIQFGAGRPEKVNEALDAFWDTEKPATSIRNLYVHITGDASFTGRVSEAVRLQESIGSATFDKAMGDSITRRMIQLYKASTLQAWKLIANVVPVSNFHTQRRIRVGGYDIPAAVAQGAPYLAFASPDDEEVTYTIGKYGGVETVTLEAIRNDDVGLLRQIPQKLARAFARGLHEFVFDMLADNGAIYDSTALAATEHANIVTTAMSDANIEILRLKMKQQTEAGSGERLGLSPRYLFVPSNLEKLAWQLTKAGKQIAATNPDQNEGALPNFIQTLGLTPVTVEYWTDPTNYWMAASKDQGGMIEMAFLDGREEPELLVQDAPTYGSMFTHDALTWKGRHVYGGAVEDYRLFAAGIVAD